MPYKSLRAKLLYEIQENGNQGTVQDFCDLLNYDNEFEVSAALSRLVSEGKAEMTGLPKKSYREDGGAILQGTYRAVPEDLVGHMIRGIAKLDRKYAESCNLDIRKMKKTNSLLKKQLIAKLKS